MEEGITRARLVLGAAALFALVAVPVAIAGSGSDSGGPEASASASLEKQVRKLKKQVKKLKQADASTEQQVAELQGEQGEPRPPTGQAGGDLSGTYPDPAIAAGVVTTPKLASGAVTTPNLASGAVTTPNLASGAVTTPKLATGAVDAAKVLDGSLGTAELAGSIPAARVTRTVAAGSQSIPDSAITTLAFDAERYDTAAMHDDATNNSRLTAPVAGIYAITAQVDWQGNTSGQRSLTIRRSSNTTLVRTDVLPVPAGSTNQEVTTQARLAAGDYVEALVTQDSGGALNVSRSIESSPEFSMTWLAPGP